MLQMFDLSNAGLFLTEVVNNVGPTYGGGTFNVNDHLLRRTIEKAYQSVMDCSPTDDYEDYCIKIKTMLDAVLDNSGSQSQNLIEKFLVRDPTSVVDPIFLVAASQPHDRDSVQLHLQVLGRAVLLLWIATCAVRETIHRSGILFSDIEFWWEKKAIELGLADANGVVSSVSDDWASVSSALGRMMTREYGDAESLHQYLSLYSGELMAVTNLGLIAVLYLAGNS